MGTSRWADAWPDALAFAGGLAWAWHFASSTRDLVWSLWLSSLVVGYALILWLIVRQVRAHGANWVAAVFLIAFFTVHFGMFHFVHSVFLNAFFPVHEGGGTSFPPVYGEVLARYWPFVLLAAVAERTHFRRSTGSPGADPAKASKEAMMLPYRGVIRMHLLIFVFAGAHNARIDGFPVYAVVYAAYFFPWRLVGKKGAEPDVAAA
jgi:hypothetical protein